MRVRRLADTSVRALVATSLDLVLEAGGGAAGQSSSSPHAYLEGLAPGRRALLQRAVGYCSCGTHAREGDLLTVSFEGTPHSFRVARLEPPVPAPPGRRPLTATAVAPAAEAAEAAGGGGGATLVERLAELSISSETGQTPSKAAVSSSPAVAAPPAPAETAAQEENAGTAPTTENGDDSTVGKPGNNSSLGPGAAARIRLEAFYREHNPEKLVGGDIDGILAKYAGREETLFAKLEKKYGAGSSLLRTAAAGGNTGTERQGQQHAHAQSPPPFPATPGRAACSPLSGEQPTSAQGLEEKRAGGRRSPATPSMQRQTPSGGGGGGLGGDEAAAIRSWGVGETLWLVDAETSIQLSGADAPTPPPDSPLAAAAAATASSADDAQASANLPGGPEKGRFVGGTRRSMVAGGGEEGERPPRRGAGAGEEEGGEWGSVGGLSSQIQQLREAIELPLRSPEVLRRYGVRPPRGVLLHGPPGTGKTTLARAAARACGCHVIVVNGSELMSR